MEAAEDPSLTAKGRRRNTCGIRSSALRSKQGALEAREDPWDVGIEDMNGSSRATGGSLYTGDDSGGDMDMRSSNTGGLEDCIGERNFGAVVDVSTSILAINPPKVPVR